MFFIQSRVGLRFFSPNWHFFSSAVERVRAVKVGIHPPSRYESHRVPTGCGAPRLGSTSRTPGAGACLGLLRIHKKALIHRDVVQGQHHQGTSAPSARRRVAIVLKNNLRRCRPRVNEMLSRGGQGARDCWSICVSAPKRMMSGAVGRWKGGVFEPPTALFVARAMTTAACE